MAEQRYIPVVELPGHDEADDNAAITWNFDLPPNLDDPERIVVDTRNLETIHKAASFRASHVFQYHGEKTEYTPSISGAHDDGTATAGATAHVSLAETQKTNKLDDVPTDPRLMRDYFKTRVIHELNKNEISSQVVDMRDSRGGTREEAWAKVVNKAVAQSMREASYSHLMGRTAPAVKGLYVGVHAANVSSLIINDSDMPYIIYAFGMGMAIGIDSWRNKQDYDETFLRERRWSLLAYMGYMQPEKYVATNALTRALPVIRYRK